MIALFLIELILCVLIIEYVPYTEIDWTSYMQHVRLFLNGISNYSKLIGNTGPAVYPAGYLYFYTLLYWVTRAGRNIITAQWIFMFIYLVQCVVAASIMSKLKIESSYALLLILSKRIHSIYILRLFNDCIAMLIMYIAIYQLLRKRRILSAILFSLATSVKMNTLLFAPGWAIISVWEYGWLDSLESACWFILVQGFVGVPFLRSFPREYLTCAFDFNRSFDYKWTVNWRFVAEDTFSSQEWKVALLIAHISTLLLFANYRWLKGGLGSLLSKVRRPLSSSKTAIILFESNLIGIICARSLHYQFYCWYYHSIWILLLKTIELPMLAKIIIALAIEYCWNSYPSTPFSSVLLLACNILLLLLPKAE